MSFENLTTNEVKELKPGDTITMGREKYGLESKYISREHRKFMVVDLYLTLYANVTLLVEVSFLEDRRCFVRKASKSNLFA
jgi:hypothetical protein